MCRSLGTRWFVLTEPLFFLLKKDQRYWSWEPDCQLAWEALRDFQLGGPPEDAPATARPRGECQAEEAKLASQLGGLRPFQEPDA